MEPIRELRATSAFTSASTDAPFIALLDWEMPGMSGPDICRAIRSNPSGPYRYLIVITVREGEEGIAEAMASGADDFVRKPFGVPEVVPTHPASSISFRQSHCVTRIRYYCRCRDPSL